MPCIPPYQEIMGPGHREEELRRVNALKAEVAQFLPALEALLRDDVQLGSREDAQRCVSFLRELSAEQPPPPDDPWYEGERLEALANHTEVELCVAGTLAWLASGERPELAALRQRHAEHREADRKARLAELNAQATMLPVQAQESLLAINRRIAEVEALSLEAICRDREAF